jgi:hypothetical protein
MVAALSFGEEPSPLPDIREVPPPPVVSGLAAIVTGTVVDLSWKPAEGIGGDSIILRSDRPITATSAASAERRGTVSAATTSFSDTILAGKDYYYAVLSRDASGTEFTFFIPANNALLVAVSSGAKAAPAGNAAISDFGAIRKDDAVILTWNVSIKNKNLILYRSTNPFADIGSLSQAVVVTSGSDLASPCTDYPVPGISWYYAILDEDTLSSAAVAFTAGVNTSSAPMEVPSAFAKLKRSNLATLRPMPLPWLNPSRKVEQSPVRFPASTEKIIDSLVQAAPAATHTTREPFIFKSDLAAAAGGEEFSLKKILDGSFKNGDWAKTIIELNDFLSVRRTSGTASRAHFYLGEANYFSGNYQQSLLEFLNAEDLYYNQSREWIQYALEEIIKTGKKPI